MKMTAEHDKYLCEKYPTVYARRHSELAYYGGFACGDGWFKLIDDLSTKIETYNRDLSSEQGALVPVLIEATQIKQKLGTLRFYTNILHPKVMDWVREAEAASAVTCETCGQTGRLRCNDDDYLITLCDTCNLQ